MLQTVNPTQTSAWKSLKSHQADMSANRISDFFAKDIQRFNHFSKLVGDDFLVDYSKNKINQQTIDLLIQLANECGLKGAIEAQFTGKRINATENRAVLHTALRDKTSQEIVVDGQDILQDIQSELDKMNQFCDQVHSGKWKGYTGKPIKNIVNIGIGGYDLGPVMVTEALKPYWKEGISTYFVSNVDGTHIAEVLKKVDAEETLFIIASKTFTTQETMRNATTAKEFLLKQQNASKADVAKHFIALSTNLEGVQQFGIDPENMFQFWDWVGGRFSLTSAIGMSIALTIGFDAFDELLSGFHEMDQHFRLSEFDKNVPVLLALIGIWNCNFLGADTEAILPYDQYMHRFAAYFQQANMESNGKSVNRNGERVNYETGPIVWGEPGTNGQHAFYQLIHQGTKLIPCDFIAPANSHNNIENHHQLLLSNFFAQTEALMNGKTKEQVVSEFEQKGIDKKQYEKIVPFKVFSGDRPSNSILVKKISPITLGKLIAMYEHKIFVQGVIWNVFSYDQWGVELGKQLAKNIVPELNGEETIESHDSSTNGLINQYKAWR